jgi:hypothetical protein
MDLGATTNGLNIDWAGDSVMTGPVDPPAYHSLWQLRGDAWGRLEDASERLAAAVSEGGRTDSLVEEVGALYELLEPIEYYWWFPGTRRLERARRMFVAGISTGLRARSRVSAGSSRRSPTVACPDRLSGTRARTASFGRS